MDKQQTGGDRSKEQSLRGSDDESVRVASEQEQDSPGENTSFGSLSRPEGDGAGENKVATSLDDE